MIELPFMNISFLRNAQAEEKEEMSYFCMHAPAADGHAAAQMPEGAGRGVPAGAAPGPPRQLQHPQPWGGHTHTLPPSLRPRMRHHQLRTFPRRDTTSCCPSAITLHAQHPASLPVVPRGGWGGLAPSAHSRAHRAPCAAGSHRRGSGAARLHRRFLSHTS